MENYIVSARKYRPATFDTVVGQQALTTTLKNAIASGKLAHAYLFCGPRGVGKTTCARIFAKTINCLNPTENNEACNECESCKAFNEQRSYNIHELDAASNNSVDEIRTLIEQVRIPPQIGKYKVYIIDEVHMLTTSAFNAFLKTLEEPPRHAIFILATTEKHKIIPTILSRCQTYDFSRISINDTVNHLLNVARKENIEAEPEALNIIAQKADGGMRDALSIFDQIVSYTGGKITYQDVLLNLNVLDYEVYFKMVDFILQSNISDALLLLNSILQKGFDGAQIMYGLASHLRDLLISKDERTLPLLETTDNLRQNYLLQAQKCNVKFLYKAMKLCNECDMNYRTSKNKRLLMELTLIQCAQLVAEPEDSVGGRSPIKTLKPIFNQTTETSASPQKANEAKVADNTPNPAAQRAMPNFNQVAANKPARSKGTPVSISIHPQTEKTDEKQSTSSANNNQNVGASTTPAEIQLQEDKQITEAEIRTIWKEYANLLPQSHQAYKQRMLDIWPEMGNDHATFTIKVENQIVADDMGKIKQSIEQYMCRKLGIPSIVMDIQITEKKEVKRAYTNQEKYNEMIKTNPNLQKLQQAFNMRFGM